MANSFWPLTLEVDFYGDETRARGGGFEGMHLNIQQSQSESTSIRLASPFYLHGVGPAYTWKLAFSGIQTIQELLDYHDLSELSEAYS